MDLDESMLPTNHERRSKKEDEGTSPRLGDIEMQDSAGDPDLDELDKDIGEPYLSCRSSKAHPVRSAIICRVY